MKKRLLMTVPFILMLVFTACNKDQEAVKILDGSWELVKQNGETVAAEDGVTYKFDNCKLKNDDYCDLTITDSDTTESVSYKVKDDGETLVLRSEIEGVGIDFESKIIELTKTILIMDFNFIVTTRLEFEKK